MDELKIIKYLDGEMSPAEKSAFEEEIRMNPPLAEEVARFRKIQELSEELLSDEELEKEVAESVRNYKSDPASSENSASEFRQELENAGQRYFDSGTGSDMENHLENSKEPVWIIRNIWYRAAAIIILAIILSILVFRPFESKTSEEVFASYFNSFYKTEQVMELARNNNDFLFAVEVYEAGDFDRAAVLFEMLADSSVSRSWSLFYAGSSYLSMNQTSKAIELFQELLGEGENEGDVSSHASWQLALCYIHKGEPVQAREFLEILSTDPLYRNDARRIIRILY